MAEQVQQTQNPKRLVMVCVDASEQSEHVFDWAIANLRHESDKLLVFHCHELHLPSFPQAIGTEEWQKIVQDHEAKLKALEQKYKAKCEEVPTSAKIKVHGGAAGRSICECAKEEHVDVIVLGSRGLGAIRRTILGSVSDYVLHHAHVPVIVVPKKS